MITFEKALDMLTYIKAVAASASTKVTQHMRNYLEKLPFMVFPDEYKPALHTILAFLDANDIETGFDALASKMISIEIRKSWKLGALDTDVMKIVINSDIIPMVASVIADGVIGRSIIANKGLADIMRTALSDAVGTLNIFRSHVIGVLKYLDNEAESYPQGLPEVLTSYAIKSYILSKIYENRGIIREELFNKILRSYILEVDEDLKRLKIVKPTNIYIQDRRIRTYKFEIF